MSCGVKLFALEFAGHCHSLWIAQAFSRESVVLWSFAFLFYLLSSAPMPLALLSEPFASVTDLKIKS